MTTKQQQDQRTNSDLARILASAIQRLERQPKLPALLRSPISGDLYTLDELRATTAASRDLPEKLATAVEALGAGYQFAVERDHFIVVDSYGTADALGSTNFNAAHSKEND